MATLANTKENNAKVAALKKIAETKWIGNTIHDTIDKCLVALNLDSTNSGWYKPIAVRVNGLIGWFMVNENGSIFCEARIIKEGEKQYRIEYMTSSAWGEFENEYCKQLN